MLNTFQSVIDVELGAHVNETESINTSNESVDEE